MKVYVFGCVLIRINWLYTKWKNPQTRDVKKNQSGEYITYCKYFHCKLNWTEWTECTIAIRRSRADIIDLSNRFSYSFRVFLSLPQLYNCSLTSLCLPCLGKCGVTLSWSSNWIIYFSMLQIALHWPNYSKRNDKTQNKSVI